MTVSVVLTYSSQAGLYSSIVTSFVLANKANLKADPTDRMVYYLEQHSTILSQISHQLASSAPQVSIPSTLPPPFPPFNPKASDIRINAIWFMALTFSLSAAFLAILVQQWVRDYMDIFQRYSDPLKCARIRQYLYEGLDGLYMPSAAEVVPSLLHVSLFLFFVGLADYTLKINMTIGLSTTIPVGICGSLYILTTFAPVFHPQSPYQNSFSAGIWYAMQTAHCRIFKDRDGKSEIVSANLAQGQMQLSMEETEKRKARDVKALRWLLDNVTEDAEIESFAMSIPGSLNGKWSFEVWTELSKFKEDDMPPVAQPPSRSRRMPSVLGWFSGQFRTSAGSRHGSPPNAITYRQAPHPSNIQHLIVTTPIYETNTIPKVCGRIAHLFDTCKNRAVFTSDGLWQRRTRACIEATASLVCYADADLRWFGDIMQILGDIGNFEGIRDLSLTGRDQPFVVRWTCLSMMAIRPILSDYTLFKAHAESAVASFGALGPSGGASDKVAEENAQALEKSLVEFMKHGSAFVFEDWGHVFTPQLEKLDIKIYETIAGCSHRITRQIPGLQFDLSDGEPLSSQIINFSSDPLSLRLIPYGRLFIKSKQEHKDLISDQPEDLKPDQPEDIIPDQPKDQMPNQCGVLDEVLLPKNSLLRQLWRLQDLRDGGGLGLAVELFLLSLKQLLSTSPSQESYSPLYIATFKAITCDWRKYKHSIGTQKLLLDAIVADHGFLHGFDYPEYITDELWNLLGNILEGQTGPHIDSAVQDLTDRQLKGHKYGARAEAVISRLRASCSQDPSNPTRT